MRGVSTSEVDDPLDRPPPVLPASPLSPKPAHRAERFPPVSPHDRAAVLLASGFAGVLSGGCGPSDADPVPFELAEETTFTGDFGPRTTRAFDAVTADLDLDGDPDLLVNGHHLARLELFRNEGGRFELANPPSGDASGVFDNPGVPSLFAETERMLARIETGGPGALRVARRGSPRAVAVPMEGGGRNPDGLRARPGDEPRGPRGRGARRRGGRAAVAGVCALHRHPRGVALLHRRHRTTDGGPVAPPEGAHGDRASPLRRSGRDASAGRRARSVEARPPRDGLGRRRGGPAAGALRDARRFDGAARRAPEAEAGPVLPAGRAWGIGGTPLYPGHAFTRPRGPRPREARGVGRRRQRRRPGALRVERGDAEQTACPVGWFRRAP